jgi:hypothetical protein
MTRFSLFAELEAKPGKEEEVAAFLSGAQGLVAAEHGSRCASIRIHLRCSTRLTTRPGGRPI